MGADRKWVIVRIDGKIAAVSTDYRLLAEIAGRIASEGCRKTGRDERDNLPYEHLTADVVSLKEVWDLRRTVAWKDLMLFGTDFQKRVWRKLYELTHPADEIESGKEDGERNNEKAKLICYSDFAESCRNRAGVRAVAHAVGLNPVSVIIPCHLVIPKESIDRIREIRRKAESTIFKGDDLCMESILSDPAVDFGNYALGRDIKRELITMELFGKETDQ